MQRAAQPLGVEPGEVLERYYQTLLKAFGPQRWWPARTRLEVILGAVLTQNTSWRNVTVAIRRLRKAGFLRWAPLRRASSPQLEASIRPAGYYRQKARTIRSFVQWLESAHGGSLDALFAQPPQWQRKQLLALRGLGPETVDAILLYAGKQRFFVADAYTRRILGRHELIPPRTDYADAQQFLHRHLPADQAVYNEFHALLVEAGKRHCRRQAPQCEGCPLEGFLPSRARRGPGAEMKEFKPPRRRPRAPRDPTGMRTYGYE